MTTVAPESPVLAARPAGLPVVSILTPMYDTDPAMLRETVESVLAQDYPYWELCLVDDFSTKREAVAVAQEFVAADARIRLLCRPENGNISRASNDALAMATGEFVALLDHDDLLHRDALAAVVREIVRHPDVDYVYSDEDKIGPDGKHKDRFLKPDWSPELLLGQMFTSHFSVYRRSVVEAAGGFREGYEGSQDWDLALRVTEQTDRIRHVPRVLYHWRLHDQSTASSTEAKPYVIDAGRRAVGDALVRRGIRGTVTDSSMTGQFFVDREPVGSPLVSVVLQAGNEDPDALICISDSLLRSAYSHWEVLLLDGSVPMLPADRVRTVPVAGSPGERLNAAVAQAHGEIVLVAGEGMASEEQWLRHLVAWLDDPGIGVAGGKLWAMDQTLVHAGFAGIDGELLDAWHGCGPTAGYFSELILARNCLGVSLDCLATRTADLHAAGGFTAGLSLRQTAVDYCLRLRERGLRTVLEQRASLLMPRQPAAQEEWQSGAAEFHDRWGDVLAHDPYWPGSRRLLAASFGMI